MHLLCISPTPSHPQDAGNRQRIFQLLNEFRNAGHRIHFCFIQRESVSRQHVDEMRTCWDEFSAIDYDRKDEKKTLGDLFGIDDWFSPKVEAGLTDLAATIRPDIVLVEYVFLSRAFNLFKKARVRILDAHDMFADRHVRLAEIGIPPSFFYTSRSEEARGLDRADIVLSIQDHESAFFRTITKATVLTVGYLPRVQAERAEVAEKPKERPIRIGYLASSNAINVQSFGQFLRAVDLNRLKKTRSTIHIAGTVSPKLAAYSWPSEAKGSVVFHGALDRVDAFYEDMDLVVNPHLGGTGLKIKTVEALHFQRPVIGTADAFAGLNASEVYHASRKPEDLVPYVHRFTEEASFKRAVEDRSRAVFADYRQQVNAQFSALFAAVDTAAAGLSRRGLLVTDIEFWQEKLGNHARIAELVRNTSTVVPLDILVLRSLSKADKAKIKRLIGEQGNVYSFKDFASYADTTISWLEKTGNMTAFERKSFARAFFRSFEQACEEIRYSFCIIEYIRLSYLRFAKSSPAMKILDTHDVMSLRVVNFSRFGLTHHIQISATEELTIFSGFECLLAIQLYEFHYLDRLFPNRTLYCPHVVPVSERRPAGRGGSRIVFVGGDSPMNRDGLKWFLAQVWPCFSIGELHIAGDVCSALNESEHERVFLHGRIDNLDEFLRSADIAINPVYYGGGLKIKTVEYLCYGIPAVLTDEAVFGIAGGEGSAYQVARSRGEFVRHLSQLLGDTDFRRDMADAAFDFGRRNFGSGVQKQVMKSLVLAAAAG